MGPKRASPSPIACLACPEMKPSLRCSVDSCLGCRNATPKIGHCSDQGKPSKIVSNRRMTRRKSVVCHALSYFGTLCCRWARATDQVKRQVGDPGLPAYKVFLGSGGCTGKAHVGCTPATFPPLKQVLLAIHEKRAQSVPGQLCDPPFSSPSRS